MKHVNLYTDGACSGNPGPGGWAAVLEYKGKEKEISGFCKDTTNNRMELCAVIEGLKALKENCEVSIHSDSAYVVNAFTRRWIDAWQKNGWKNSKKQPVENPDLWQELLGLLNDHNVEWIKVKGHSGEFYNERCDAMARKEIADNVLE